jgi:hypothetical protein
VRERAASTAMGPMACQRSLASGLFLDVRDDERRCFAFE